MDVAFQGVMGLALLYLAYQDLRYHKVDSYVLPIALFVFAGVYSFLTYGFDANFVIGFIIPFVLAYLTQLVTVIKFKLQNPNGELGDSPVTLGGLDIIILPVCTSIFGSHIIYYLLLLFIPMSVTRIKPVKRVMLGMFNGDYSEDNRYKQVFPLLPLLIFPFLIKFFLTALL